MVGKLRIFDDVALPSDPMSKQDAATVFVRNLPYDATNEALETHFSEVGPVRRAFIVCDKATKVSRGFGFVSFVLADVAQRAVASLNGKEFKGRRLSIDGAKPGVEVAALGLHKVKKRPADAAASATAAEGGGAAGAAPSSYAHGSSGAARKKTADETGKALRLIVRNLSFRCDEAALRNAFEPHGTVAEVHVPMKADGKHSGFGFVQMSSQAECDAAVAALNETKIVGRVVAVDFSLPKARYEKQQSAAPSAAPAASTTATEVQIRSLLERYGPLRYVTVVRDPATKLSRGTAFACFTDPRAVLEALLSEQSRRPWLLGQQVQLVAATNKASATQAADERRAAASVHKKEGSKRHLELARLGLVQPDEEGAKDLTPAERLKREQAWAEKKEKLSNPNFVVSEFRLSVRNLPTTVDEAQLRKLAYEGALAAPQSAGRPVIKQVKILRDEGRLDRHGMPRSRGFGFVHFESHAHALAALHALSDNPNVLPERRRMLVEFAVDNVQKLKRSPAGAEAEASSEGGDAAASAMAFGKLPRDGTTAEPARDERRGERKRPRGEFDDILTQQT
ncbi:RNA-binding protein 28 isoform 1 [Chrysochromulina tobinii]|uniref:RNA-binding protein 28 isoform 1 n=1 Tax=Chrysochromulina tobinii TaxID=1460289 RepID=A0A0M0JEY4_9EUKA|nr:RNA-binding protein 28 isoform 1 [Chrysochromulina tobinii]|eukprot:KOO24803.1 RNA-binding protein 28 isoform 1 [Chrysochromulina sp. CCMP291]